MSDINPSSSGDPLDEVIEAARALAIAIGAGVADHMLGLQTYVLHPPEGDYEEAHHDAMLTFAREKIAKWVPLHDRLRIALERLDGEAVSGK